MASPNDRALVRYNNAITAATSVVGAAMLLRRVVADIFPDTALGALLLRAAPARRHTVRIDQFDGVFYNRVFLAARAYVSTLLAAAPVPLINASLPLGVEHVLLTMSAGSEVADVFGGAELTWRLRRQGDRRQREDAHEVFHLSFDKRHKDMVLRTYLPFVMARAEAMAHEQRQVKLYSNERGRWRPDKLRNASTFETLAMDAELRRAILDDIERFLGRKEYYERTGRAWKRGYLIYGPHGTGKSSLVAAISNHLHFDVYDLELGAVRSNTHLRKLLMWMKNRSILLVEDIDCAEVAAVQREADGGSGGGGRNNHKVTLSGLLNMVDGLWSSGRHERIIVFTANRKDRLDPALLRPGRMDMHIHMGYCGFGPFMELASTYHGVDDHRLFPEIEELLREVEVAPTDVANKLLMSDDADVALEMVVKLLKDRKAGAGEDDAGDRSYVKQKIHVDHVKWPGDGPSRHSRRPTSTPPRRGMGSVGRVLNEVRAVSLGQWPGSGRSGRGGGRGGGRGQRRRLGQ